jgi:predicted RNA binding protein YcfA (HicA-like mRNA interferase family)
MGKPERLGERVVRALKRASFVALRQRGSHVSLQRRIGERVFKTVVPLHSELAKGTLADILKRCGVTVEELITMR